MSLLTKKRAVLAKIESTYGVDPVPTGAANAMLVSNLSIAPIEASLVSRDLMRPYLGNSQNLLAETHVKIDFEVEYVGSGVVGLAPAYDPLMLACGFSKATSTAALTINRTGSVATATLNAHGYAVGDKIVISGATQPEYNGTMTITGVTTNTFDYAVTGTPATPATGAPVATTQITYSPISSSFQSCTIYYSVGQDSGGNSPLHKITGAFGSVDVSLTVKQIPKLKFSFVGIYNAPTDAATPSVDFTAFMLPQIANTQNTPGFSLFGYSGNMESMNLSMGNDVQYITLIGAEYVKLLDRKPGGTLVFEAPTITGKDFFTLVKNTTSGALTINHGSKSGYKVNFAAQSVLLGNPSYQDSNAIQMLSAPFTCNPVNGNDELSFIMT